MNIRKLLIVFVLLSLFSLSRASTTCEVNDCKITITIKIAFAGADDAYIQNAKNEIENVWNGPNGRTYGDCNCPVSFKVETTKTADCVNNPPAGYHCITVTDYNNNPPRNQTNWTGAQFYLGYMYGIATGNGGNSQKGWWSNIMSRPVDPNKPDDEHYKDFAHEAGHMIGLEDCDGGLMCQTSGPNSNPTQANIDEAVNEICGATACPDRCCCGNGVIDRNKNEQCDPMVGGCRSFEYCCPVCCHCYRKVCFPENGEYADQENCQANCGPDAKCCYNYKTGCWDCVTFTIVEEPKYVSSKIQGITEDDHTRQDEIQKIRNFYTEGLRIVPTLREFLTNERINIIITGGNTYHLLIDKGELYEVDAGAVADPTVKVTTDIGVVNAIHSRELSPVTAVKEKRITTEGVGFLNGIKFWLIGVVIDNFVSSERIPEGRVVEEETTIVEVPTGRAIPKELDVPASGGEFPEGKIHENVLKVDTYYELDFNFSGVGVYGR